MKKVTRTIAFVWLALALALPQALAQDVARDDLHKDVKAAVDRIRLPRGVLAVDVIQEICCRMLSQGLQTIENAEKFANAVARNLVVNHHRRNRFEHHPLGPGATGPGCVGLVNERAGVWCSAIMNTFDTPRLLKFRQAHKSTIISIR